MSDISNKRQSVVDRMADHGPQVRKQSVASHQSFQSHHLSVANPDYMHGRRKSRASSVSTQFEQLAARRRSTMHRPGMDSSAFGGHQAPPKIANTYKMEPDVDRHFRVKPVKDVVESVLEMRLSDRDYDPHVCKKMVPSITDEIREKVKLLGYDRYKLVIVVNVGSLNDQGLRIASRCTWDDKTDNFASCSYSNKTLFAVAMVFGVYQE